MDALEFVDLDYFFMAQKKKNFSVDFVGLHNLAPKVGIIYQY